ncbi:MAG: MerR family DNA-binding transcriptional regulator [Trichococcus flocculiformis]
MNISEAAEKSGLTAVTLRYYERIGLICLTNPILGGLNSSNACAMPVYRSNL